jgi:hypothetical protein
MLHAAACCYCSGQTSEKRDIDKPCLFENAIRSQGGLLSRRFVPRWILPIGPAPARSGVPQKQAAQTTHLETRPHPPYPLLPPPASPRLDPYRRREGWGQGEVVGGWGLGGWGAGPHNRAPNFPEFRTFRPPDAHTGSACASKGSGVLLRGLFRFAQAASSSSGVFGTDSQRAHTPPSCLSLAALCPCSLPLLV